MIESTYDLSQATRQPLDAIFAPKTVAVIGASEREDSIGRLILWNLISNPFGGTIFPVNPKRAGVMGIKAYPSIAEVPERVDLAVIVTPAPTVPGIIRECVKAGVKGAVVISAGFKETGAEGVKLEQEIMAEARKGALRIVGPNCLGVMRPVTGLNATFARAIANPGNVAFISQSGALLTAILDWSLNENVGFSAFVSAGSMLDVDWGDLIYYLGEDPHTQSILIYMESIGNARSFLSAAREVTLRKPIIVIKGGRTAQAARAAASHTGSLAGSDEVLSAAFRRTGVLRVDQVSELFDMAEVLSKQPRPKGPRLTILTNAGGPGVLATDALISGGGKLTPLSEKTVAELNTFLPPHWSHDNPVDILGDADAKRFTRSLQVAAKDENSDGLLVTLVPVGVSSPAEVAEEIKTHAQMAGKPIIASWMGGVEVQAGEDILNQAGIPTYRYPDTAARVFNYMWRYSYNLRGLYETPSLPEDTEDMPDRIRAEWVLDTAVQAGRTLLSEYESKQLLASYGIATVETRLAISEDEAVAQAERIGYPVVLKLHSHTITHKTDVGGVVLNLRTETAVRQAYQDMLGRLEAAALQDGFDGVTVQPMVRLDGYEVIVGSSIDAQFGPVLLFGAGGTMVEVFKDRALALPPLTSTLARRMMEQTKIYEAFKGVRGRDPVDLEALELLMVRFSQLVVEQRLIKEIDINPLLVSADGIIALDARVILHEADEELPRLAIRAYPRQYVGTLTMKNGEEVVVRPIRPEDEPMMVLFHNMLSEHSVYMRYATNMKTSQRVAHERLARICFNDYAREIAMVVERNNPESDIEEIIAVGRLTKMPGTKVGEFAVMISDAFQGQGIGTELLRRLVEVGRQEGLTQIVAYILWQNRAMQAICRDQGFEILHPDPADELVTAVKVLG